MVVYMLVSTHVSDGLNICCLSMSFKFNFVTSGAVPVTVRPPHPQNLQTTLPTVRMIAEVSKSVLILSTQNVLKLLKSKVWNALQWDFRIVKIAIHAITGILFILGGKQRSWHKVMAANSRHGWFTEAEVTEHIQSPYSWNDCIPWLQRVHHRNASWNKNVSLSRHFTLPFHETSLRVVPVKARCSLFRSLLWTWIRFVVFKQVCVVEWYNSN